MAELDEEDVMSLVLSLEKRITWLERIENAVSLAAGLCLAIPYLLWWYAHGFIRWYSALIPLFIGSAITKLGFAIVEARLARRRKELASPKLPEARLLTERSPSPVPPPPPAPTAPAVAPEPAPAPPAPGEEPRLLK